MSLRGNDDKNQEAVRVSNLDTLRFSDFNIFFDIYMRLLNTARHWNLINDYLIEIIAKSKSTPRVGITQLVELTTEVNYLLIKEVNQRWDEMPAQAQQLLEELAQLQLQQ